MLTVRDYIKLLLKKKKWSHARLCRELNKVEAKISDARTVPQNVTNYLNGYLEFSVYTLIKYETVFNLPVGTLISMVEQPFSKSVKKEFNKLIKKIRGDEYGNYF